MRRPSPAIWLTLLCHLGCGYKRRAVLGLEVPRRQIDVPRESTTDLPLLHFPSPDFQLAKEARLFRKQQEPSTVATAQHLFINDTLLMWKQQNFNYSLDQSEVYLEVEANSSKSWLSSYRLKLRLVNETSSICRPGSNMCFFSKSKVKYFLPDSLPAGQVFDVLHHPLPESICKRKPVVKYSLLNGQDVVDLDSDLGSLSLRLSPDPREIYSKVSVGCSVLSGSQQTNYTMDVILKVHDVDNNPPYIMPGKSPYVDIDLTSLRVGKTISDLFNVYDKDGPELNNYIPRLEGETLGLFTVDVVKKAVLDDSTAVMISGLTPIREVVFPNTTYSFQMIFEDKELEGNSSQNKVVFYIQIHNHTAEELPENGEEFSVNLSRSASLYSQVGNMSFPSQTINNIQFQVDAVSLITEKLVSAFSVTPTTGIVYVDDEEQLRNYSLPALKLNVSWVNSHSSGHYFLMVNLSEGDDFCFGEDSGSCAVCQKESDCVSTCGQGSPIGRCQWRNSSGKDHLTSKGYATCSPSLLTCPDGTCDELETMHRDLCPQDCASELHGQVRGRGDAGIEIGRGICSCAHLDICTCHVQEEPNPPEQRRSGGRNTGDLITAEPTGNSTGPAVQGIKATTANCGAECILLFVVCPLVFVVVCVCGVLYLRRRCQRRRKGHTISTAYSLNVVPAEYREERRYSSAGGQAVSLLQVATLDQTVLENAGIRKNSVDKKWEFSRECLTLMQVLGEGEFGRVVKGRAWSIKGHTGYTTVAVKMLKENSSSSDRNDLLSELNLLKEVNHFNVIQLLGACTQKDGPLYVIVEYAEFGSLRSYLRQCRRIDLDRMTLLGTVENPSYITEAATLKYRDLLSFSWQTAKGMAYLSDMKVVHRDLAARNILLASGKIIKISDFGLSRDVYEGDTYLKKSKGRVPVKWMALESLQDHVYTTKSDVWSFGVVLWEIVTLGASPYPATTPERLFQLLKAGYRMERPDNCSKELYLIMMQCWRQNPSDRPSFKSLVQKLECILESTAAYLDLVGPWAQLEELGNESSCDDEPFTPLTYRCFANENHLEYGKLCHLPSESSDSSGLDVLDVYK